MFLYLCLNIPPSLPPSILLISPRIFALRLLPLSFYFDHFSRPPPAVSLNLFFPISICFCPRLLHPLVFEVRAYIHAHASPRNSTLRRITHTHPSSGTPARPRSFPYTYVRACAHPAIPKCRGRPYPRPATTEPSTRGPSPLCAASSLSSTGPCSRCIAATYSACRWRCDFSLLTDPSPPDLRRDSAG